MNICMEMKGVNKVDALKFMKESERMCELYEWCRDCPVLEATNKKDLTCAQYKKAFPKEYIETVEKWSKEHPKKTYLMKFIEMFPDAPLRADGYPMCRPCHLGWIALSVCPDHVCRDCWDLACEEEDEP